VPGGHTGAYSHDRDRPSGETVIMVESGMPTPSRPSSAVPPTGRRQRWAAVRHHAFVAWSAVLSLLLGGTFVGLTLLTIGLWFANRNHDTTPITDLGFFALGAVIITTGLVVQPRAPERHLAGLQQATIGLLALGVAGLIGGRVEPLTGALILLVATAPLVALHPARRRFFTIGRRPSAPPVSWGVAPTGTASPNWPPWPSPSWRSACWRPASPRGGASPPGARPWPP
jgi:hypothetical protein